MTAAEFTSWLAAMKAAGLARSEAECGRLLGVTTATVENYKGRGTDRRTALACRALISALEPWP